MNSPKPRVVFMGTPELARVVFAELASDSRWEVLAAVVQPDKPVGRGLQLQAPPVKIEAAARGIPVLQPPRARDQGFIEAMKAFAPDVIVVAAYGQILPPSLLAIPRRGCLNVHTSLLPRWRGAAPIQWAILEGDSTTGVTVMHMDAGLDTGGIVAAETTPILAPDTGQTLHDRLAILGAGILRRILPDWLDGKLSPRPQPASGVTYARKLAKEDGRVEWSKTSIAIDRVIRALNPWPGAFTTIGGDTSKPRVLKIWEARELPGVPTSASQAGEVLAARGDELWVGTGGGNPIAVTRLQLEGRRRMTAREFLAGGGLATGMRLGIVT